VKARFALLILATLTAAAQGADPAWPPSPETRSRIEALQRTMGDPAVTAAQRMAARDELARLLMHPGAQSDPAAAPMRPRAAVDAAARLQPPAPARTPIVPAITPVAPPTPAPHPVPDGRGGTVVPGERTAIDPRTGALLIDVGNGWIDPATGRFVPRN
jgi:hypothetical protein